MIWRGLKYQEFDFSDKYEISEYGDIRNKQTGTVLKPQINRGGYKYVCLSMNQTLGIGQRKTVIVHKAVAYTYLDNPSDYESVDHIDCDKLNNHYSNLEWVSMAENSRRAYRNGLYKVPAYRKLSDQDVRDIRNMLASGDYTHAKIARRFNVARSTVSLIKAKAIYADVV